MDLPQEARAYADADFIEAIQSFIGRLLELTGERNSLNVIDLGTGPGSIPIALAQARPSWRITAVDAAEAMLRIAKAAIERESLTNRITLRLADVKSTGLPAKSFDLVLCSSVLHHMPDPLPLWREIARLAASGALVFVRDLRRPESEEEARKLVALHAAGESDLLKQEFHRSFLAAFTPDEVRDQLLSVGLSSLRVEPIADRYLDIHGRLR